MPFRKPFYFVLVVSIFVLLEGCASRRPVEPFYTRLYEGTLDEVWLATLKALSDYPIKFSNKDAGKIQTEIVNGPYNELMFTYPEPIELPERFRYSLKFSFANLNQDNPNGVTRVRIAKELERFQDFYAGWIPFTSDGLEERVLLYRIEHLFKMGKSLTLRASPP